MSSRPALSLAALALLAPALAAQEPYRQPPAPIAQILDAEPLPAVSVSPDRAWLLLLERSAMPAIAEVAAPELRLAGERIDPRTSAPSRSVTYKGLRLRRVGAGEPAERRIEVPSAGGEAPRIASVMWSPDGARIAYTVAGDSALTLWLADVATGASRRLGDVALNAAAGTPCAWISAAAGLVCRTIPAGRGAAPVRPAAPAGPVVQQSEGRAAPNRTYQDLLEDVTDEKLFDHYFTSQLAIIAPDGRVTPVGKPAIHTDIDPSPDGRWLLVETVHRPYSYLVPMSLFPRRIEVWELPGGTVAKQLADLPLQEEIGTAFDAVPEGPRNVQWRASSGAAPAALVWVQALDGGNPAAPAARRDRLYSLEAPFGTDPVALLDAETRIRGVRWVPGAGRAPARAVVDEYWWRTRRARSWLLDPARAAAARLLWDRSAEDRYGDPGSFVMTADASGDRVVLTSADGRYAYLEGDGASPQGDMPFLDRIELATGKTTRLWRSAAPYYEEVVALLDGDGRRVVTRRESPAEVPNYWLRDLRARIAPRRLTSFTDPAPQFAGITPRLITYTRADGVQLSATLYLPAGYDSTKGPLPFLFWAYPREFKTAAAAAQVQGSPYRFVRPTGASHLLLLTQGYGILDGPTMPIVGEGNREPNDTYVEQLVASARAAVDKVVEMGIADRDRIGIGGHSYGAFMTANLLAHSDLFRAGIARSGAYNRTLTPFGFQAEERPYWRARDIYSRMSPFTYADSIAEPILLIHGMADDNSGTFPVQSERFYAALKGNGATVRYVQLPAEAHGYRARESVGHTLWEMVSWMDRWVKPTRPPKPAT
ncbi:MAG TPA: prolyl oligopeptidase family serine peptidase [Gemmatimonadaceae bacterium]|nr:prolyl oligopeptidase family serine peptidase [Gemmatimonadaceae bacterium]